MLLSLVNAVCVKETDSSSLAGITCLTSIITAKTNWIIDSRAIEHITPYIELLHEVTKLSTPYTVLLPDGNHVAVTHSGKCSVSGDIVLVDVLHVPEIKFNQLSVSKLITNTNTNTNVTFKDKGCYLQDQANQTFQWLGKLDTDVQYSGV